MHVPFQTNNKIHRKVPIFIFSLSYVVDLYIFNLFHSWKGPQINFSRQNSEENSYYFYFHIRMIIFFKSWNSYRLVHIQIKLSLLYLYNFWSIWQNFCALHPFENRKKIISISSHFTETEVYAFECNFIHENQFPLELSVFNSV